uniref:RING-type domain-containing protein n=1 Tax=Meloidogyne javanica TaxID=6303 RepID=A0A915LGT0_MELJA
MESLNQKETNAENFSNENNNQLQISEQQQSNSLTASSSLLVNLRNNNRNPALHPTREDSPYPGREELAAASTLNSLAESAATASLRLQHQINLMAQAMATPGVTAASFPLLSNTNSMSSSPQPLSGQQQPSIVCDSTNGLSTMLGHYVAAAAAVSTAVAIHQQQRQDVVSVYNTSPNLVTTVPVPALCSCTLPSMFAAAAATSMAVAAAGVCPYHQTSIVRPLVNNDLQIDLNNNAETGMRLRNENNGNNNSGETAMLAHGRQRQAQIFHRSPNRISRSSAGSSSSLKRSNTTAFPPNLEAVSSAMLTAINNSNTINVSSSSPPLLFANPTQIRLATGEALNVALAAGGGNQGIDEFNEGPSRAPKLRRILSFDEDVSEITESVSPSTVPSITSISEADIEATSNATAAALVQIRQRAQTLAAISTPLNEVLSIANSVTANSVQSSALTSLQQNPSALPLQNQQAAAVAVAAASTVAAGMEQIVAAALSAANAASALSPQALAAITGATAAVQCAVCAAAACQSRLSNPGATPTAVTACSCLHHHHHHLHCHNHQTLLPHQPPPICTLCNSNVTNGPPTPSVINNQNNNNSATVGIQVDNPNVGVVRPQQGYLHQSRPSALSLCPSSSSNLNSLLSSVPSFELLNSVNTDESNQQSQRFLLNSNNITQSFGQSNGAYQLLLDAYNTNNMQRQQQSTSVSIGINIGSSSLSTSNSSHQRDLATSTDSQGQAMINLQQQVNAQQQAMNLQQQAINRQAASFSPSAVTAMLLNSAAAMGQQQTMQAVPAQQQQQMPSLYSLQRGATLNENNLLAQVQAQQNMNTVHQSILAIRLAQQERERETANHFYQQQQIQQRTAQAAAQHRHLMRPLFSMPQALPVPMTQMDLSSLVLLHNHPGAETSLVLNGGGSALSTATNPHHIVANAMAAATAAEPQPVGATLEQIKRHSQKLSYVEDPNTPEQERERCTICLCEFETGDELRGLNCGHLFHMECIDPWLQQNKKCPLCRVDMDKGISVPGSSNALENVENYLTEKKKTLDDVQEDERDNFRRYKLLETSALQQKAKIDESILDYQKSIDSLKMLAEQKAKKANSVLVTYKLDENLFSDAVIEEMDRVCIWLGANVMVEYKLE